MPYARIYARCFCVNYAGHAKASAIAPLGQGRACRLNFTGRSFRYGRSAGTCRRVREKFAQVDLKSLAKVPEGYDGWIAFSQLKTAHIGAINTHSVSQLSLT